MDIIIAALVVGAMGLIFGVVLAAAGKAFAVPTDPKVDALRACLPGANCGACGYPGCEGYAAAVAKGEAKVNKCAVGGPACTARISEIMGIAPPESTERMVAALVCGGSIGHCKPKAEYDGLNDCLAASLVDGGDKSCAYACLGLGNCERACQFDAIHVDPVRRIAFVDEDKCQSCTQCVAACPKHVLTMKPATRSVSVNCSNPQRGRAVSVKCNVGCIGCGACEAACKFGALQMVNGLPVIDYSRCVGCLLCAEVCPTHAIEGDFDHRLIAKIDKDACIGCTLCKRRCEFDAIKSVLKQPHEVTDACTGCGKCAEKCPKQCITMVVRDEPRDPEATV